MSRRVGPGAPRYVRLLALATLASTGAFAAEDAQRRAAQLEDLAFARTAYVEKTGALSPADRESARKLVRRMERSAGSLSSEEFAVGIMRIAALAHNAHDAFDFGDGAWLPAKRAPLRMLWFGDALLVARAGPEYADLLGAQIEQIEGRAPAALLERLAVVSGGIEAYRRWNVGWIIENGFLRALGLARSNASLRLALRLRDGKRANR